MFKPGKKITRTTLKSFLKKNEGMILSKTTSRFDGMVDCVMPTGQKEFIQDKGHYDPTKERTLGFDNVYLVGDSRDYFDLIDDENHKGIRGYNCVGAWQVVVPK